MFPGRHTQVYGVLTEEVQVEFGLWENLVPEEVREGIGDAKKDGKELGFESADGGKRVQLCCSYIHQAGQARKCSSTFQQWYDNTLCWPHCQVLVDQHCGIWI